MHLIWCCLCFTLQLSKGNNTSTQVNIWFPCIFTGLLLPVSLCCVATKLGYLCATKLGYFYPYIYTENLESVTIFFFYCSYWISIVLQGKKGVWIKLPIHLANLVEALVKVTLLLTILIMVLLRSMVNWNRSSTNVIMYQFYGLNILSMTLLCRKVSGITMQNQSI